MDRKYQQELVMRIAQFMIGAGQIDGVRTNHNINSWGKLAIKRHLLSRRISDTFGGKLIRI
jgi:hypothetical protein